MRNREVNECCMRNGHWARSRGEEEGRRARGLRIGLEVIHICLDWAKWVPRWLRGLEREKFTSAL